MYNLKNKKIKRKIIFSLVVVFILFFAFLFNINNNFKTTKSEVNGLLSVFELNDSIASLEDNLILLENSDLNLREKSNYFKYRDSFLVEIEKLRNLKDLLTKSNLRNIRQIQVKINDLTDTKNKTLTAFQYDNKENLIEHETVFKSEINDIRVALASITRDVREGNEEKIKNVSTMIDSGISNVMLLIFLCLISIIIFAYFIKKIIEKESVVPPEKIGKTIGQISFSFYQIINAVSLVLKMKQKSDPSRTNKDFEKNVIKMSDIAEKINALAFNTSI